MGKVLKILGVVFLLLVLGFVGLLIWSHEKGEDTQEQFFQAVLSGDPARVMAQFDPEVAAQVDEPVLALWMAAIREHLGAFKGLAASKFSTSASTANGRSRLESSGTVHFEKGDATSSLVYVDGKIVKFEVLSDKLPDPWFQAPPANAHYVARGQACLEALLQLRVEDARAMMHESLRQKVDAETAAKGIEAFVDKLGGFTSLTPTGSRFEPGKTPLLEVTYAIQGGSGAAVGTIGFQFTPWKGELTSFDVKHAN
jgi:hypothetical protein